MFSKMLITLLYSLPDNRQVDTKRAQKTENLSCCFILIMIYYYTSRTVDYFCKSNDTYCQGMLKMFLCRSKEVDKPMPKSSNATSSAFGWDFQSNAAIMLMLDNIKEAFKVKVEGENEDVEITFNKG